MTGFNSADIKNWERFYRANFINSLTGFKSVNLIGTVNEEGQTNLAIFSSIVHIGSNPPLVGYINRPIESAPHTLHNIKATGVYTINHIHNSFVEQAHQTSAKYAEGVSEFEITGLTPDYREEIKAPFVKESRVKYALLLEDVIPIRLNGTFLVIGKITDVYLDEKIISPDGFLHLEKAGSVACNGADGYYKAALTDRFEYAKPGLQPGKKNNEKEINSLGGNGDQQG